MRRCRIGLMSLRLRTEPGMLISNYHARCSSMHGDPGLSIFLSTLTVSLSVQVLTLQGNVYRVQQRQVPQRLSRELGLIPVTLSRNGMKLPINPFAMESQKRATRRSWHDRVQSVLAT